VQLVRYLVVLLAGILAGGRAVEAVRSWNEWRSRTGSGGASGADAYKNFLMVNIGTVVLSICLAALLWHLLRPKKAGTRNEQG
jgi:hypothetical protein